MTDWTYPSLADTGVTAEVRCKCKRMCQPERMYDVRSLGVGDAYRCSACVAGFFRKGMTDRVTFYRRGGAPQAWLDDHIAKLKRGPLLQPGLPQEVWGEIYADALEGQLTEQVEQGLAPVEATWAGQLEVQAEIQAQAQAQVDGTPPAV
jgi:hypothetical protein